MILQTSTSLRVAAAVSLALAAALPAGAAVHVSATGQGQVLLFPYYTVNAGNSTLIQLANNTDEVKALKVRFREAMNGRAALDFNLYLAPHADWRAALASPADDAPPRLITVETDCTVPAIPLQGVSFRNNFYVGPQNDDGPDTLDRTREGFIEVIEMGVVVDDGDVQGPRLPLPDAAGNRNGVDRLVQQSGRTFARDARTVDGVPRNCNSLHQSWLGGVWDADPGVDMDEPSGGISGSFAIVDVAAGVAYAQRAETLDGFFTLADSAALHTGPGSLQPTLASARTRADGAVEAFADGMVLRWAPGTPNAVSSVLMHRQALNEFATSPLTQAASEWVVTFPTRHLHIEGEPAGVTMRRPFADSTDDMPENLAIPGNLFDQSVFDPGGSCEPIVVERRDEDGELIDEPGCGFLCPEDPDPAQLCWQTNVVAWNQFEAVSAGHSEVFGSRRVVDNVDMVDAEGSTVDRGVVAVTLGDELNFMIADPDSAPGTVRDRLSGLPAIGFWAARFVNGNAQPGILASYAVTMPHVWSQERDRVTVTDAGLVTPVPEP